MTGLLAATSIGLAIAVALLVIGQRSAARRLIAAGNRLEVDVVPTGRGLAEATSVVERVVDRSLMRGRDVTLAETRLAGALAGLPQGVVVFDADAQIAFRNRVAAGYLAARHGEALVEEAIQALANDVLAGPRSGRSSHTIELFGPPRRTLVVEANRLDHSSRELGAIVVIDDITDRRRLEAVRRDFVANISHELKTPVGALGLLAEALAAEDDPAVSQRLAQRMVSEAFRVSRTIDDLLELSRIEVDSPVTREDLDLASLVAEATDRVRSAADQQGISIEVATSDQDISVSGDRRQLVSAIYNLIDNAVKYSDTGSSVAVRTCTHEGSAEVAVTDLGMGIPRRDLERVFERFYRVDRGRSRETGGTGLGLAIVRHVADNHQGEVHVSSVEGQGSTFTLRLRSLGARPELGGAPAGTGGAGGDA